MTTRDHDHLPEDALPDALRDGLRALRTDTPPAADLWPGIAARLACAPGDAASGDAEAPVGSATTQAPSTAVTDLPRSAQAAATRSSASRRPRRRWALPTAIAASVALAVALGWSLQPPAVAPSGSAAPVIAHEARAMTREYRAAFAAIDAHPLPASEAHAIAQLDRSAADVRAALAQAPESRLLLTQLKRVYARRLDLSQRFARTG